MAAGQGRSVLVAVAESVYRFGLGSIAGCKFTWGGGVSCLLLIIIFIRNQSTHYT